MTEQQKLIPNPGIYFKVEKFCFADLADAGVEHRQYVDGKVPLDHHVFHGFGPIALRDPKGNTERRMVRFPLNKSNTLKDAMAEAATELEVIQNETQAEYAAFCKKQDEKAEAKELVKPDSPAILAPDGRSIFGAGR